MASVPAPPATASSEFRDYLARDWRQWLEQAPPLATMFGVPGWNDRWTDDSAAGISARRQHLAEAVGKLDRFERSTLAPGDLVHYDLYRQLLVGAEEGLAFGFDPAPFRNSWPGSLRMPVTQMSGVQFDVAEIAEIQPRASVRDFEDLLRRHETFPVCVDNNLELLDEGRRLGYTPPRITLVGVPDQIAAQLTGDPLASAALAPFKDFPASVSAADRERLTARAIETYRGRVVPALAKLRTYLETVYIPGARETVAATALPDGVALYQYLVRWQTTIDVTPQQVHELGLAEVRRIRAEMDALIRSTGFAGTFAEFNQFIRTDPQFFYRTSEELLDGYRVIAKKIDPALSRLFGRLPRLPYGVIPVPDYRAPTSPTAYYLPGAPAAGRPGNFYANLFKVESRAKWEMEALTLHEAVPGHHLQIALMQEEEELPEFRRQTWFTAFTEGWGLYAESLGEELGLYRDPYSKFGQLSYDMWRAIRLVVDTGMHALGWSREQAIRFFRENSGASDLNIQVEVDRYLVVPAQALAYKIGQLKIRELRTLAEHELGDRFDTRAFHDVVLHQGSVPLGLLEDAVRRWIDGQRAG